MSGFQSANNNNTDMFPQDYADKDIFINGIDETDEHKKGYKLYNFRRPDKFSKDHLRVFKPACACFDSIFENAP